MTKSVMDNRHKNGQCVHCGIQTHEVKGWRKTERIPLTIPGSVENGRCVSCHRAGNTLTAASNSSGGNGHTRKSRIAVVKEVGRKVVEGVANTGAVVGPVLTVLNVPGGEVISIAAEATLNVISQQKQQCQSPCAPSLYGPLIPSEPYQNLDLQMQLINQNAQNASNLASSNMMSAFQNLDLQMQQATQNAQNGSHLAFANRMTAFQNLDQQIQESQSAAYGITLSSQMLSQAPSPQSQPSVHGERQLSDDSGEQMCLACPTGHQLILTDNRETYCDCCQKDVRSTEQVYYCDVCQWDMCSVCKNCTYCP